MFIEFIDLLRCPRNHEDSWLVAAFTSMNARFVVDGKLGCPICASSYPIVGGIADLRIDREPGVVASEARILTDSSAVTANADDALRFAALLGLSRPGALVVMERSAADFARGLTEMTDTRVVAVNPIRQPEESERVGVVLADGRLPFAAASIDGIVFGEDSDTGFADAARVLKPGGRIVAPVGASTGDWFRELARDDRHVVAESIGPLISLGR